MELNLLAIISNNYKLAARTESVECSFRNLLPVKIRCFGLDASGNRIKPRFDVDQDGTSDPQEITGDLLVTAAWTGALIGVITPTENTTYDIRSDLLTAPNDIGPIPKPTALRLIPTDSPSIAVGFGEVPMVDGTKNRIIREQRWQRSSESYSIAPGETQSVAITVMTGRQESTTDTEEVSKSISSSVSGGWGPISASISASLSQTSSHSQQLTVENRETRFVSQQHSHPFPLTKNPLPITVYKWHLTDYVTVFSPTGIPVSSVIVKQSPALTDGPYVYKEDGPVIWQPSDT